MAKTLTGKFWTSKPSRLFASDDAAALPAWALPVLGLVVAVLHSPLGYSLGLPGHHGLELMTALLFARLASTRPWACLMLVSGTVAGDFVLSADVMNNVKNAPLYFMFGGLVDAAFRLWGDRCRRLVIAAAIGATVHLAKPLLLTSLAVAAGTSFGFMRHGAVFPVLTYASFGAVGAICGALLARSWHDARRRKSDPA